MSEELMLVSFAERNKTFSWRKGKKKFKDKHERDFIKLKGGEMHHRSARSLRYKGAKYFQPSLWPLTSKLFTPHFRDLLCLVS